MTLQTIGKACLALTLLACCVVQQTAAQTPPTKVHRYCRFQIDNTVAYGLVEGDQVRQVDGDLLGEWKPGQ